MTDGGSSLPPPVVPAAQPADNGSPPPAKKAWWKRWWFLALAVAVPLLIIGAIAGGGSDDDDEDATTPTTTEGSVETTAASETTTSDPPATTEPVAEPEAADPPSTTAPPTTTPPPPPPSDSVAGAPPGSRGDRSSPVPVGAIADLGDGWRLQVLAVTEDATSAVLEENQFNEPPPEGSRFTLVQVALGYYGLEDPVTGFVTTIAGVASANTELSTECGVVPDALDQFTDVFSGGVITGNVCFVTTPADTGALQLYATQGFVGPDVFLAASSTPEGVVRMGALRGPQPGAAATAQRQSAVPLGTPNAVGDGWTLTVTAPASDITDAVLAANQFNEPPRDGYRFVGVTVQLDYAGEGAAPPFNLSMKFGGDSNVALEPSCGVTPGELDQFTDVFAGGSITGVLCAVSPTEDLGTHFLYVSTLIGDEPVFFAAQ